MKKYPYLHAKGGDAPHHYYCYHCMADRDERGARVYSYVEFDREHPCCGCGDLHTELAPFDYVRFGDCLQRWNAWSVTKDRLMEAIK